MMDEKRLEAFERMMRAVRGDYEQTVRRMERLKAEGKEKTATYRQLMGNKLTAQNLLQLYRMYGLMDKQEEPYMDGE